MPLGAGLLWAAPGRACEDARGCGGTVLRPGPHPSHPPRSSASCVALTLIFLAPRTLSCNMGITHHTFWGEVLSTVLARRYVPKEWLLPLLREASPPCWLPFAPFHACLFPASALFQRRGAEWVSLGDLPSWPSPSSARSPPPPPTLSPTVPAPLPRPLSQRGDAASNRNWGPTTEF